jgi:cell division protein ZapE
MPDRPALPVRGLYIWGSVGRGKTYLMDLFYESLDFDKRQRSHFYRFMRDVHAELRSLKDVENPLDSVAQRIAQRFRIICFDEFFVSDIGDAMILGGLFEGLFKRGVTLVATSNVPPPELYKDGLQRQRFVPAIGLLLRNVEVFHLDGSLDYRLRALERTGTYLDSKLPSTTSELACLFTSLAGSAGSGACELRIDGRMINARAAVAETAWFEFAELCEGPRSQNDYIELAHDYRTVFLSNVPVFDASRDDAARRFIMLVDEFYDRSVKLVLSAAAQPAALYTGERLAFEFERTASRLIEMQSKVYLAKEHIA